MAKNLIGWDDEAEISFPEIPRMEDIPTYIYHTFKRHVT